MVIRRFLKALIALAPLLSILSITGQAAFPQMVLLGITNGLSTGSDDTLWNSVSKDPPLLLNNMLKVPSFTITGSGSGGVDDNWGYQENNHFPRSILDKNVKSISLGEGHACALTTNGGVKCWGNNSRGQLGNGTNIIDSSIPRDVNGLTSGIVAVSTGGMHACALTLNGGVKCWGDNTWGQLGNGTTVGSSIPLDVSGLTSGVVAVSAGMTHTCALITDGGVKCWGLNFDGQIGDGTRVNRLTPVNVIGLSDRVSSITVGWSYTCALLQSGGAMCWGNNSDGQLGDGTTTDKLVPVDVAGLTSNVASLSAGYFHTCAMTLQGESKCWGDNSDGQLGDGTNIDKSAPVVVSGLINNTLIISAGWGHSCAVISGGKVKCWGENHSGQLGDGTNSNKYVPVDVDELSSNVAVVAAGDGYTCAISIAGGVACWGTDQMGQLGDGAITQRNIPANVSNMPSGVKSITTGYSSTCALTTMGQAKCWGANAWGQLGDGTTSTQPTPVDVFGLAAGNVAISAGANFTCVLTSYGGVKCWGSNMVGELGDGTNISHSTPTDVVGLSSGVVAISAHEASTCVLNTSGGVKCWGANPYGELGDGTTTNRLTPVNVIGLSSGVIAISTGESHSCALMIGGSVECWGDNSYGQIGDGTTTQRNSPVNVLGLTNGIVAISAGYGYTCALDLSGVVKCWGRNNAGQLGDGTTVDKLTPVTVKGLSQSISAITTGWQHACVLTQVGGVECWGDNTYGQIGDKTNVNRLTPVSVYGLSMGITAISAKLNHTCVVTVSGAVKCWGSDTGDQLGIGTPITRNKPINAVEFVNRTQFSAGAVPLYYQGRPSTPTNSFSTPTWYEQTYGNLLTNPDGDTYNTIGRWGCNTTSNAMIISHFGRIFTPVFETDPGTLNLWLRNHNGYDAGNNVIYGQVCNYARINANIILSITPGDGPDDQRLTQQLQSGLPAMLKVPNPYLPNDPKSNHFVVATGVTTINGQTTYTINDPIYGDTTLLDHYNNQYRNAYYYTARQGTFGCEMMQLSVHSPVDLLVTDPLGRKIGFDPSTGTSYDEVPNAGYFSEIIGSPDGSTSPDSKTMLISNPINGDYDIQVIGYDVGSYEVEVFKTLTVSGTSRNILSGTASSGSTDNFSINFYQPPPIYLPMITLR